MNVFPLRPGQEYPNLVTMLAMMAQNNAPCMSLVRPPVKDVQDAGVIAVMAGVRAKPFLKALGKIARKLPTKPGRHGLDFDWNETLDQVFAWMDLERHPCFHGRSQIEDVGVDIAGFTGLETCRVVARALTVRGCPTEIEPRKRGDAEGGSETNEAAEGTEG